MGSRASTLSVALTAALLLAWPLACSDEDGPECRPTAEKCDGVDEDCDGVVDNGFDLNVACSAGLGACAAGGVTVCAPGGASAVCDAVPGEPAGEQCNGIDDDCDSELDEGIAGCCHPGGVVACGVDPGVCQTGTQTCGSDRAWGACLDSSGLPVVLPGQDAEVCNGLDDDCDDATDEGFDVGEVCTAGIGTCQTSGHQACAGLAATACDAKPGEPGVEACDGLDNDCNGETDEELPGCCAIGTVRACGENQGVCVVGTQTCSGQRAWGPCVDASGDDVILPGDRVEDCNGLDDDCDGQTDENGSGNPLSRSCYFGPPGTLNPADPLNLCRAGVESCTAGGWGTCTGQVLPVPEECDGFDNDCDGSSDESFPTMGQACDGFDLDQCTNGTWTCKADGTGVECVNEAPVDIQEICDDAVDNDCDGDSDCADADCAVLCAEDTIPHCTDQLDNDQDGRTDCFDPTCQGFSFCVENSDALCHDGKDNDGDAFTDCADPDCASFCSETTFNQCHDGLDNDQDGQADCMDGGCGVVCSEATVAECHDSLDNDQDTRVDCADAGCAAVCP